MIFIPNPSTVSDILPSLLREEAVSRDARATGRHPGPITGFKKLDGALGGFLAPGLHTFLAAPGAGKTSFTAQIGAQCACPCLYITAEMRPVEILRRIMARESGHYLGRLRGGELSDDALRMAASTTSAKTEQFMIYDATRKRPENPDAVGLERRCVTSIEAIESKVHALKERFETDHILIILDSLTKWARGRMQEGQSEYAVTESSLEALSALAISVTCPMIVIVHRHRDGNKNSGENQLFSGKASGSIEYEAESLWVMEKKKDQKADEDGHTERTLTLHKNRYGEEPFKDSFLFEGRLQKFTEV